MAIGGFFKALGKGARAVGRGAMKGVLGFDDRDIRGAFGKKPKEDHEEPDGDEVNEDYSGYSRGVADLGTNDSESDGVLEGEEMETPVDIGVGREEALIGLEMSDLPGFKKPKMGARGGARMGGVKIEAPKTIPTAYETVTAGQSTNTPMGLSAPGAGAILDTEESLLGKIKRNLVGDRDAEQKMALERENPDGLNTMSMPGYMGLVTSTGVAGKSIPGLMRGKPASGGLPAVRSGRGGVPAKQEIIDIDATAPTRGSMLGGGRQSQIGTEGAPGFEMRGGSGPTPYSMPAPQQLPGAQRMLGRGRPMPGPGGMEGPMPPLPPGVKLYRGKLSFSE